jgi:hypothetical protein
VGPRGKSWLAKHLEEVTDAFLGFFGEIELARLGVDEGKIPENPAPVLWALYHQMERWHALPNVGGLLDQPYILMAELDALDRVIAGRKRQAEAAAATEQNIKEQMQRG